MSEPASAREPYRVVQWASAHTGHYTLRGIIEHPELEPVGLLGSSPG